jgi:hypothetical protein
MRHHRVSSASLRGAVVAQSLITAGFELRSHIVWGGRAVKRLAQAHGATVVLVEDKASGTQLIQDLVDEGLHGVQGYQPEGDRVIRGC